MINSFNPVYLVLLVLVQQNLSSMKDC